jgi:glucokinase
LLAADVAKPGEITVIISGSGRAPDLVEVAENVQARGGTVIAITASQSPLARKADVALIVDHVEDVSTHVPMISRILHLLVIDILAVGLAMRRQEAGHGGRRPALPSADDAAAATTDPVAEPARARGRAASNTATPAPLSRLTSHSR